MFGVARPLTWKRSARSLLTKSVEFHMSKAEGQEGTNIRLQLIQ